MSAALSGIDYVEKLARINNLQADTAAKLAQTKWAGWQVAFAGFTSGAAVVGAIIALIKILGV